jgi:hypothetical protein
MQASELLGTIIVRLPNVTTSCVADMKLRHCLGYKVIG